jgi:type IV pilus assembly protein PilZ
MSNESASSDRRHSQRASVEVDLGVYSESNFFTGLTRDISDGGLFVATHVPLPVGTEVTVKFTLPGCAEVTAKGVVAWLRDPQAGTPGMGVRFSELRPEDEALIHRFISKREPLYHDD